MLSLLLLSLVPHAAAEDEGIAPLTIVVKNVKMDGQPWDFDDSLPDLGMCILVKAGDHCEPTEWGKCEDSTSCTFPVVPTFTETVTVWVYDRDLTKSEAIGSAVCTNSYTKCKLSGGVLAVQAY